MTHRTTRITAAALGAAALTLGLAAAQADETQASLRGAGSTLATPLMRV